MKIKKEITSKQATSVVSNVMSLNFQHCLASRTLLEQTLCECPDQAPTEWWETVIDAVVGLQTLHGYYRADEQESYLIDSLEEEDRLGLVYTGQFTHGREVGVFLHRDTGKFSLDLCTGTGAKSTYFASFRSLRGIAPEVCDFGV